MPRTGTLALCTRGLLLHCLAVAVVAGMLTPRCLLPHERRQPRHSASHCHFPLRQTKD